MAFLRRPSLQARSEEHLLTTNEKQIMIQKNQELKNAEREEASKKNKCG